MRGGIVAPFLTVLMSILTIGLRFLLPLEPWLEFIDLYEFWDKTPTSASVFAL